MPQGVWLTGPITLDNNIELHLDKNAIIYFSPDKRLYVETKKRSSRVRPCISADKKHDIAITGEGIIDGNGQQWRPVKRSKVSDVEWKFYKQMGGVERNNGQLWYPWAMASGDPDIADSPEQQEKMRNDLVRMTDCQNLLFKGVTFQNAPKFHVHPCYCENVIVDGITVRCPWNAQNGDAIDFSDCHRGLIVNCIVDAGDDGLCMKSGRPRHNSISGVEDVESFDEQEIVMRTSGGCLVICGEELSISRLSVDSGDVNVQGYLTELRYEEAGEKRGLGEPSVRTVSMIR